MDKMKGVSAVHVHFRYWGRSSSNKRVPTGMRSEGNVALSQLTLEMISCDSGTKSSLGPNSYFTGGLIYSKNPTLGYVLLVPPMPRTVALAN